MRAVLCSDVTYAARVLLAAPAPARIELCNALFVQANVADKYSRRFGRMHPYWGDGTLAGAAHHHPMAPTRPWNDPAYAACLLLVLQHLAARLPDGLNFSIMLCIGKSVPQPYLGRNPQGAFDMAEARRNIATVDPVWDRIHAEAKQAVQDEPLMGGFVHACILHHPSIEKALSYRIAAKLTSNEMSMLVLRDVVEQAYADDPSLVAASRADLVAIYERDPACHRLLQPILYFKGYQAVQAYRVGHYLWKQSKRDLAYFFQMRVSEIFGVDIHPAAKIGKGIMIDHAHSVVIGETAVVGDNVSMLHSVTLGGTGKEEQDRHPKIGDGVLIGAGAKVLGNIKVGSCSRIAAGSVVLEDVPPCKTVAGIPARIVGEAGCDQPSVSMNHMLGPFEQE